MNTLGQPRKTLHTHSTRTPGILDKKNNPVLFIFMVTILLVVVLSARAPLDADMWWHIRSGEMTIRNGSPLLEDTFSFTRGGAEWSNHSWLSQVILFLTYQAAGFFGLSVYTALLAAVSMGLIYRHLEGPPLLRAFLTILASAACALVWTPRPQMFSLVLFALLYSFLAAYRKGRRDRLWVIPLIFIAWSNLHGGFPIGMALLAVFIVSEAAQRFLLFPQEDSLSWGDIRKLSVWSVISIPAVLLNPNGIKTWLIPFQTVGITALQNLIQEWASPDFHDLSQQVILWLLFLMVISFSLAGRRMNMGDILIPLAFAYMTFLARRNIYAFAMAAIPAASRGLSAAVKTWQEKARNAGGFKAILGKYRIMIPTLENQAVHPSISRLINLATVGFLAALAFGRLGIMSLDPVINRILDQDYPVEAVHWMKDHQVSGNLFNEYNWGGYLVFISPETPVFVDGRTDLFGDEIIGEWQEVVLAGPEWRNILDKWGIDAVLLQPDRPVIGVLMENGWQDAFHDEKAILLLRK